jgi:hypothetical protein
VILPTQVGEPAGDRRQGTKCRLRLGGRVICVEGGADLLLFHQMGEIVQNASGSLAIPLGHPAFGSAIGGKPPEKEPGAGNVRDDRRLPEPLAADGVFELGEPGLQLSDGQCVRTGYRGI